MQAHTGFAKVDIRTQQDRRALNGIGAQHEQITEYFELLPIGADFDALNDVALVFECAHFGLQAHIYLGMAVQLSQAILRGELGVHRAEVAGGIGTADASGAGRDPSTPGRHDEMMVGHGLLHQHVDGGAFMRRLGEGLAARQHSGHVWVARDRHDLLGLAIVRLKLGIAQRPIVADTVARPNGEIAGMQTRRLRIPAIHSTAQGDGGIPGLFAAVVVCGVRLDGRTALGLDLPIPGMEVTPLYDQCAPGEVFQGFGQKEARTETRPDYNQLIVLFVDVLCAYPVDLHDRFP